MTDLLIRDIEPHLKRRLEERARKSGESLSRVAQSLIRRGLEAPQPDPKLGTMLSELVPPEYRGDDLVFEYHGEFSKPPDFE